MRIGVGEKYRNDQQEHSQEEYIAMQHSGHNSMSINPINITECLIYAGAGATCSDVVSALDIHLTSLSLWNA